MIVISCTTLITASDLPLRFFFKVLTLPEQVEEKPKPLALENLHQS